VPQQDVDDARNPSSRQRTGSRRPARAAAVRSVVNRASAPRRLRFAGIRRSLAKASVTHGPRMAATRPRPIARARRAACRPKTT
jgi:hypothetical protein